MKQLPILIAFILISLSSIAQEYIKIDEVTHVFIYSYTFCEEHKNPQSAKKHEMILEFGQNHSKFYSSNKAFTDSLLMRYANESPEVAFSKIFPLVSGSPVPPFCNFYVYKNYPTANKTTFIASDLSSGKYQVEEDIKFDWTIDINATDTISGLICHKAQTSFYGRNYTAWFSLDIPINDGPYKFNGLPGLIVQIADTDNEHIFTLKGLASSNSKPMYYVKNRYTNTTSKGYVNALEASKADLIKELEKGTFSDENMKIRAIKRVQNRNNFIEKHN